MAALILPPLAFDAVDYFDRHMGEMRDAYVRLARENEHLRRREVELMKECEQIRALVSVQR